jgi:hypothetical protein
VESGHLKIRDDDGKEGVRTELGYNWLMFMFNDSSATRWLLLKLNSVA